MDQDQDVVLRSVAGFARVLRAIGIEADPERVHAMVASLAALDPTRSNDVYWAGRIALCANHEDLPRYDRAFGAYFGGHAPSRSGRQHVVEVEREIALPVAANAEGQAAGERTRAATASHQELLRNRDVARLTDQERMQVNRLIALMRAPAPMRPSRRRFAGRGDLIDRPRSMRAILENAGEPTRLRTERRATRPRRIVLLIDVSGSMIAYADSLLRFAHACLRSRPGTEVFTLGTRLTRVTRELSLRDPNAAMAAVSKAIPDWNGGTRLGEELKEFLDRFGHRGTARGATVVLASDGWERGDVRLLAAQTARLQRLSHQLLWVNPHKARQGFQPVTAGMAAALPYVDDLVEGHSVAAFDQLTTRLTSGGRRRA